MKGIHKLGTVIAKILEVFHWVGTALMAAATVCSVIAPQWVGKFVAVDGKECCGANLEVYGFEINAPMTAGQVDGTHFLLFGIGASLILAVMAMVFRNLYRVLKLSEDATPFQKETVRLLRAIGVLVLAVPVIGFLMSIVVRLVTGAETAEIALDLGGVFMGIVVLIHTRWFVRGAELENDVDGLL